MVDFSWQVAKATHLPVGPVPADFPFAVEAVTFPAADGLTVAGWFVPCPGATRTVVLLHGAKRNRLENVARARLMRKQTAATCLSVSPCFGDHRRARPAHPLAEHRHIKMGRENLQETRSGPAKAIPVLASK